MNASPLDTVREIASEIENFRLRFSVDDGDLNWSTVNSFRHLAKRFESACKLVDEPGLNNLLENINTDIELEAETADLHAELLSVAAYVQRLPESSPSSTPSNMMGIERILHILTYRDRGDLAQALRGSRYELNESSTYGSRLFSTLTTLEIYSPIQKHDKLQKLSAEDRREIVRAFHVLYPVRDNEPEINEVDFLIDPSAQIPAVTRGVSSLANIDFIYISEQIEKCDERIAIADFEGAITNARNLVESICKYLLDELNEPHDTKSDLPALFKKAASTLSMHPSQHVSTSLRQILSGCFNIVQGLAAVRNELSDAHGKSRTVRYKPEGRHAMFAVGVAKSLADFMYASYVERSQADG